jgi:hypothetical protein
MTYWYDKAERRVNGTPDLKPYRSYLLYDWPENKKHLEWVATAPDDELINWAETMDEWR